MSKMVVRVGIEALGFLLNHLLALLSISETRKTACSLGATTDYDMEQVTTKEAYLAAFCPDVCIQSMQAANTKESSQHHPRFS